MLVETGLSTDVILALAGQFVAIVFLAGVNYNKLRRVSADQRELKRSVLSVDNTCDSIRDSFLASLAKVHEVKEDRSTVKDIAILLSALREDFKAHERWSGEKVNTVNERLLDHSERIAAVESNATTLAVAISQLAITVKEVDNLRTRLHALPNDMLVALRDAVHEFIRQRLT